MSYHYFTLSNCCEYALLRISTKKRVFLLTILSMQVNLNWCRILNHDTLSNDDNLPIPAYELIRIDHPSNQKQDAICTYICIYVRFCKKNNISYLKECLNFSLSVNGNCVIPPWFLLHQVNDERCLTHSYQILNCY